MEKKRAAVLLIYSPREPRGAQQQNVTGNETFGIDFDLMKYCSDLPGYSILEIPQPGLLKSLNVSNSASIVLWEYYRQVLSKNNIQNKYDLT